MLPYKDSHRIPATYKTSAGMDDLSLISSQELMKFEPGQDFNFYLTPETMGQEIVCQATQPSSDVCGYGDRPTVAATEESADVLQKFPWVLEHGEAFSPPCPVPQQADISYTSPPAPQTSPYPLQASPYPMQTSPYPAQTSPYHSQPSPYSTLHSPYAHQTFFPVTPSSTASPPPPQDPAKEEIRKRLMMKRKERGQPEIKVEYKPQEPEKLTQRDVDRRRLRRERNKRAAHKCREKKRGEQEKVKQVAGQLETDNIELRRRVRELEQEKNTLKGVLAKCTCKK